MLSSKIQFLPHISSQVVKFAKSLTRTAFFRTLDPHFLDPLLDPLWTDRWTTYISNRAPLPRSQQLIIGRQMSALITKDEIKMSL